MRDYGIIFRDFLKRGGDSTLWKKVVRSVTWVLIVYLNKEVSLHLADQGCVLSLSNVTAQLFEGKMAPC